MKGGGFDALWGASKCGPCPKTFFVGLYEPSLAWGYFIDPGALAYCWTKLLLDRHAKKASFDDDHLDEVDGPGLMQLPPGKTPEQVVTDYLALFYQHTMNILKKLTAPILAVSVIEFWFTLPAMWSIRAQNATREAAIKAGFTSRQGDTIQLVREPEAASISCLNELIVNGPHPLVQEGTGVLVCDCGGGTVDLAAYEVEIPYPKLLLREACVSEGAKCGSTAIDRAFHRMMGERFGPAFTSLPQHRKGAGSSLMKQFETVKRDFGSSSYDKTHRFHLMLKAEDSLYYDAEEGEVSVTTTDLRSLFDPVVKKIIGLLEQQITAAMAESGLRINMVILVGGFGESPYLYSKLKQWYPPGIELFNPPKSWEAICLGAAVRGLEGPISLKRKCRYNIGTKVRKDFRSGIDDEAEARIDSFDGTKRATGYAGWVIKRGEVVTPDTVKECRYKKNWTEGDSKIWREQLFQSDVAVAPEKINHHSVTPRCKLEIDLTGVDFSIFESKQVHTPYSLLGKKVYRISYSVVMVVDDGIENMYFRAVCNGMQCGQVKTKFGGENK